MHLTTVHRCPRSFSLARCDERALEFRPQSWYAEHDVELLLGERATGLDAPRREVQLAGGGRVPFEQLLIATGSAPRRLEGTERYENVYELRTRDDARALREALSAKPRLIVIGAGFIGQEVAATAKRLGATVTIIEAAATPLEAILGPQLGEWFADFHRREGIELVLSARIARFHGARAVHAVELEHGRRIGCDLGLCADAVAYRLGPYTRFVIDCGGDIAVGGVGAQLEPYEIAVVHPISGESIGVVRVAKGGVATSGLNVRIWRNRDESFGHHLLDPSTGGPAWTGLVGATAIGDSALEAETLSKMALLLGPERARQVLAEHGGVIIHDNGDVEAIGPIDGRIDGKRVPRMVA